MSLSYLVLILSLVFAAISAWPMWGPNPPAWRVSFFPLSWFFFVLYFVLIRGAINWHG